MRRQDLRNGHESASSLFAGLQRRLGWEQSRDTVPKPAGGASTAATLACPGRRQSATTNGSRLRIVSLSLRTQRHRGRRREVAFTMNMWLCSICLWPKSRVRNNWHYAAGCFWQLLNPQPSPEKPPELVLESACWPCPACRWPFCLFFLFCFARIQDAGDVVSSAGASVA